MDSTQLYLFALPVFLAGIVAEALYYRVALGRSYAWWVAGSNLVIALGRLATDMLTKVIVVAVYLVAYDWRLFDIPMDRWESWVALFVAVEISYYWVHRCSHEIRWMWAQHSVHHSAQQLTLSVAYRLGWMQFVAGPWLFLIPVCWIGFDPRAVMFMFAANLLYQFWLHTEAVGNLGFLEKIFNTPHHHRVHHAIEPEYLDRNYGGVLIIWDKLFGTFAQYRESAPITYGMVKQIDTNHPVKVVFAEWLVLVRDLRAAKSLREVLGYTLGDPGWKPDGTGMTTRAIRRAAGIPDDTRDWRVPPVSLPSIQDVQDAEAKGSSPIRA
jgi:sterol desaturase/sphingolipid hydroxylase (fatty acid hydroxylase superfamily)